ncbi:aminotransferase class I/II-fold pyridoxal phosphate-dependent enzyme [Ruegeria arenilitoris]|uniref:aminotransferase class I/II-fold pyridoxal phosphate-dependent enzyme n=1 Tax=Ruegeria arenilitoris TaxID=1173585 RepID=UPI003C7AAF6F
MCHASPGLGAVEEPDIDNQRRDIAIEQLNAINCITCTKPEDAFYAFANCSGVLGKVTPSGGVLQSDADFCAYLLNHYDVAVEPGSAFGLFPRFRVSYATSSDELTKALERIAQAVNCLKD